MHVGHGNAARVSGEFETADEFAGGFIKCVKTDATDVVLSDMSTLGNEEKR